MKEHLGRAISEPNHVVSMAEMITALEYEVCSAKEKSPLPVVSGCQQGVIMSEHSSRIRMEEENFEL